MGKATILLSPEFILELSKNRGPHAIKSKVTNGLPEDAKLVNIDVIRENGINKTIRITFESKFIEDMPEGSIYPIITPVFHAIIEPYSWQPELSKTQE